MEKLNHESCEALEGTWNTDGRANFDENTQGSSNVDLQFTSLVDRRVEESKEALNDVRDAFEGR